MVSRMMRSLPIVLHGISRRGSRILTDVYRGPNNKAYEIVQTAASQGLNVGLDEYPNLQSFQEHINKCKMYGIWSDNTGMGAKEHLVGLYTVGPSILARGSPTVLAEIRVFLSRDIHGQEAEILKYVIPVAEELVGDIMVHYTGCIIQVATLCHAWIIQIKKLDYIATACIPLSVDLAGKGLSPNFIFYKRLTGGQNVNNTQKFAANVDTEPSKPPVTYPTAAYPIISGSPYTPVRLAVGDTEILVRDVKDEEVYKIYTWFWQSAKAGQGYSLSEMGDFTYFTDKLLHNSVVVVFEEANTGEIVYAFIMRNAGKFQRHHQRITNTGFLVINPDCNKGLNQRAFLDAMYDSMLAISKQLGYRYVVSSTTIDNHRVLQSFEDQHDRVTILGTIPDGVYMEGRGYTDLVLLTFKQQQYSDLSYKHLSSNI